MKVYIYGIMTNERYIYEKKEYQIYFVKLKKRMEKSFDPFLIASSPTKPYNKYGIAKVITKNNFPTLNGVTVFYVEIFDESMRTIHIHSNCDEIGYVLNGEIQVFIYDSEERQVIFTVKQGECWFIPRGSLHSLNNIGNIPARLFVGFNSDLPMSIDLKKMMGKTDINPLFSKLEPIAISHKGNSTKYMDKPMFWNPTPSFSIHKLVLKPRDSNRIFWIKNSSVFYVNLHQKCILTRSDENKTIEFNPYNYCFLSIGVPHSFIIKKKTPLLMYYTCSQLDIIFLEEALTLFPKKVVKNCLM